LKDQRIVNPLGPAAITSQRLLSQTKMKFNPKLKQDIGKFLDYVIIVEGKKDVHSLKQLGFTKVYAIHETGTPLKERILKIAEQIDKKDRVCILTDFDRKGKLLYMTLKEELSQLPNIRLDSSLRGILLKAQVSHIEGLAKFMENIENIG